MSTVPMQTTITALAWMLNVGTVSGRLALYALKLLDVLLKFLVMKIVKVAEDLFYKKRWFFIYNFDIEQQSKCIDGIRPCRRCVFGPYCVRFCKVDSTTLSPYY